MAEGNDRSYSLLVSFPDDSHSFVHGFEAGKLWEQMESGDVAEIEMTTHVANREVIRRMADHLGWELEVADTLVEGWDITTLTKRRAERDRANPHGLRVV